MMRKIALTLVAILFLTALAGCNTVSGVGRDVESAGHAVERAGGK